MFRMPRHSRQIDFTSRKRRRPFPPFRANILRLSEKYASQTFYMGSLVHHLPPPLLQVMCNSSSLSRAGIRKLQSELLLFFFSFFEEGGHDAAGQTGTYLLCQPTVDQAPF